MAVASTIRHPLRLGPPLSLTFAALSMSAIAVQVFLAGLNVFLGSRWWELHIAFGHGVGVLLLVQAAVVWLTRMPARSRWLSLGMVVLFGLQYNVRALASLLHAPYLIPLHAVNALALFWMAITLAGWARQAGRQPNSPSRGRLARWNH